MRDLQRLPGKQRGSRSDAAAAAGPAPLEAPAGPPLEDAPPVS